MKTNNVLVVSPLGYTGLAYYDYSLCQSLTESGVDVELCSSDRWILDSHGGTFSIVKLYRKCSGRRNRVTKGVNYLLSSVRIFLYALRRRISLVHFQIGELPQIDLVLMMALKIAGKRVIYTPHDITHNKRYLLNDGFVSLMYSVSDFLIVHKDANRRTLLEKFGVSGSKIRVIPHGGYEYFVDGADNGKEARKRLGFPDDGKLVLFFGNIRPEKGVVLILEAMPLLRKHLPTVKLIIAGRPCGGISEAWLRETIVRLGIAENVIVHAGFISDADTQDYYMASDIVVLPYTQVSESGVLRYAQTCGRPVICSDLDEFKDTVVDGVTGYLFRSNDVRDLAAKTIAALLDPELARVGVSGKKLMEKDYRWKDIAALTKQVYEETSP